MVVVGFVVVVVVEVEVVVVVLVDSVGAVNFGASTDSMLRLLVVSFCILM